ncbi:MAG: Bacterial Ig-like domain (group 2), partial [Armatimonadetes bacterium]|nr:Bacterial Ig-like domain (group 2) [Armatimonadota bacterium]
HYFGRGLVDPVDDMRATNPASYPELLDGLAREVVTSGYDLKHVMRLMLNSRAYQLASATTPSNEADLVLVSHALERRFTAEALLDAITDATGTVQRFNGAPYGMRAAQLPDQLLNNDFLKMFGRPARDTPCECERKFRAEGREGRAGEGGPAVPAEGSAGRRAVGAHQCARVHVQPVGE